MTDRWAARFPHLSLDSALVLRLRPGIKVCDDGGFFWLTGNGGFEEIDPLLRRITGVIRFSVLADESILRIGRRIPEGSLPTGPWNGFASIAQLRPQTAALPATITVKMPIRLVRASMFSDRPEGGGLLATTNKTRPSGPSLNGEASAVVVSISAWTQYASAAPLVRLNLLRFAVRDDGQTLILGSPLPPLNGSYFVNLAGLLIPCGFTFEPRLEPEILRRAMNLPAHDLALFNVDGTYELIPAESLVHASRSAARLTAAGFAEMAGTP